MSDQTRQQSQEETPGSAPGVGPQSDQVVAEAEHSTSNQDSALELTAEVSVVESHPDHATRVEHHHHHHHHHHCCEHRSRAGPHSPATAATATRDEEASSEEVRGSRADRRQPAVDRLDSGIRQARARLSGIQDRIGYFVPRRAARDTVTDFAAASQEYNRELRRRRHSPPPPPTERIRQRFRDASSESAEGRNTNRRTHPPWSPRPSLRRASPPFRISIRSPSPRRRPPAATPERGTTAVGHPLGATARGRRALEANERQHLLARNRWTSSGSRRHPREGGDHSPTPGSGRRTATNPDRTRRGRQRARTSPPWEPVEVLSPFRAPVRTPSPRRWEPIAVGSPIAPAAYEHARSTFLDDIIITRNTPTSTPVPAETRNRGESTATSTLSLPGLITSNESLVGATAAPAAPEQACCPAADEPTPDQPSTESENNNPRRHWLSAGINTARRELRVLLLRALLQIVESSPTNNTDVIWEQFRARLIRTGQFRDGLNAEFDIGAAWMFAFQEPARAQIRSLALGGERVIRNMMEGAEQDA